MIDWLKTNWKTAFVGIAVSGIVMWTFTGCNSEEEIKVIEEAPAEAAPTEESPVETLKEEVTE